VRPVHVVVVDEDSEHVLEVPPVEDQKSVEALSADSADEALCDRVRRSHRCLDDLDAFAREDGIAVAGVLAVSVPD